MIYDAIPHSLSDLNPTKSGMGATTKDKQQWATNMLKQVEQLPDVENIFTSQEGAAKYMDTSDQDIAMQHDTGRDINQGQPWHQQQPTKNKWKATSRHLVHSTRQSEGGTSLERRAHNAPVDPHRIKIMTQNRFHPLQEERNQGPRDSDRVREGSVSDASSSSGSRMRDPISLTPEILAMLDRHEPDKAKQAKLLIEHLS